jgi:hypothetical protein
MSKIRFSPRPAAAYVTTVDGQAVGPGTNKDLAENLAAWNLYWLSFPRLEEHTDDGGGKPLPFSLDPLIPQALLTATQFVGNTRVADLAVNLTPDRFIIEMQRRPHADLALAKFFGPAIWIHVMQSRCPLYVPDNAGASEYIPGSVLTRQSDGTRGVFSSNILPLARIFARRLH